MRLGRTEASWESALHEPWPLHRDWSMWLWAGVLLGSAGSQASGSPRHLDLHELEQKNLWNFLEWKELPWLCQADAFPDSGGSASASSPTPQLCHLRWPLAGSTGMLLSWPQLVQLGVGKMQSGLLQLQVRGSEIAKIYTVNRPFLSTPASKVFQHNLPFRTATPGRGAGLWADPENPMV